VVDTSVVEAVTDSVVAEIWEVGFDVVVVVDDFSSEQPARARAAKVKTINRIKEEPRFLSINGRFHEYWLGF
jgi:hypothetical protein